MSDAPKGKTERLAPPGRRPWLTVLLYLVVFVSGMVCGAGLTAMGVQRHVRKIVRQPDLAVDDFARLLDARLDLTPDQRQRIRVILGKRQGEIRRYRELARPHIEREVRQLSQEIEQVLNPRQKRIWRGMVRRMERWLPGPQGTQPPDH